MGGVLNQDLTKFQACPYLYNNDPVSIKNYCLKERNCEYLEEKEGIHQPK